MPKTKKASYPGAMALLNYARQYYDGAEIIFASKPDLTNLLYFLYFHVAESSLKAYLKAHGKERTGHEIGKLCREAQQLGLKIERDKSGGLHLHNVAALLESGNRDAAFRYSTRESRTKPDLDWTRDVVGELLTAVTPVVESTWDKTKSGVPVKFDLTFRMN
jgi:HEPN domain-containing protein